MKLICEVNNLNDLRRSRKGAWIEITLAGHWSAKQNGRSRKGAWIEIRTGNIYAWSLGVAPVRERGLKSTVKAPATNGFEVAPVRERGLKLPRCSMKLILLMSLP